MVFYRKYRSQKIEELDSESVRNTLFSVLSKQEAIPHAFLFTGPKGLGKTSAARIVAKAVNCEGKSKVKSPTNSAGRQKSKSQVKSQKQKGEEVHSSQFTVQSGEAVEPCNECEQCKSITSGTNMDILEIDAASNRGIDEIRDLREKIGLAPLSAKKKVYIIDEVHMLTTEAFNALLKTLEEPPSHAMFILCTTEPHKVPATIISRSFHIQFKLASEEEIARSLRRIVEGEKLQVDDDVLPLIAQRSEGGFRDATKILEELVLHANGKPVKKELFESVHKTTSIFLKVTDLLIAMKARDAKSGLKVVAELTAEGVDMKFFLQEMMEFLHEVLLEQVGVKEEIKDQRSLQFGGQAKIKEDFDVEEIKIFFELFSKAYSEMKTAVLPQLPLEMAIVEYSISREIPKPLDKAQGGQVRDVNEGDVTVAKLRKQAGTITKIKALYGSPKADTPGEDRKKTAEPVIGLMHVNTNGEAAPEWIAAFWKSIISEMKQYNHTIAGVLRSCSIKSYDKKSLVIEAAYKFHKERLEVPGVLGALKKACKILTGNDMEIEVQLKKS